MLVFGWIVVLCALGTRALVHQDARYGFGMFAHKVRYTVDYAWVYPGDREELYIPGRELKGTPKKRLTPGKKLSTHYATGAMKAWVNGYVHYMGEHRAPPDAVAFKAVVQHHIDGTDDKSTWVVLSPRDGKGQP